jgi:uncharacterized RmlC-like cupin family protein
VAEFIFPAGFSPPWHLHHNTAESFYVLEGEIRFQCADDVQRHGPGGFVDLPPGVPHSFYVESENGARALHTRLARRAVGQAGSTRSSSRAIALLIASSGSVVLASTSRRSPIRTRPVLATSA